MSEDFPILLDGEPCGTVEELIAANDLEGDDVAALRALRSGEAITVGGGAWASFEVRRAVECNADLDGCDGDNGEPCPPCQAERQAAHDYWRSQWAVATPDERDPERYRRDMIDAGRGHLLRGDR